MTYRIGSIFCAVRVRESREMPTMPPPTMARLRPVRRLAMLMVSFQFGVQSCVKVSRARG